MDRKENNNRSIDAIPRYLEQKARPRANVDSRGVWFLGLVKAISSPMFQLVFYAIVLVFYNAIFAIVPVVQMQQALEYAIDRISASLDSTLLWSRTISLTLMVGTAILIFFFFRRQLAGHRILGIVALSVMVAMGGWISDYYLGYSPLDIRKYWHYLLYGLLVLLAYRAYPPIRMEAADFIYLAVALTLLISSLDEAFQGFISHRVVDLSDIAKDLWGTCMGLIVVFLLIESGERVRLSRQMASPRLFGCFRHISPLTICVIGGASLLLTSSVLTEFRYWPHAIILAMVLTSLVLLGVRICARRQKPITICLLLALLMASVLFLDMQHAFTDVMYCRKGLVTCGPIPIPFFDVLIRSDGSFRLVDKKESFNRRDLQVLLHGSPDILLLGYRIRDSHLTLPVGREDLCSDPVQHKTQIIVLSPEEACKEFERFVSMGLKVVLVIHNS